LSLKNRSAVVLQFKKGDLYSLVTLRFAQLKLKSLGLIVVDPLDRFKADFFELWSYCSETYLQIGIDDGLTRSNFPGEGFVMATIATCSDMFLGFDAILSDIFCC
jgi:hypothetical protein